MIASENKYKIGFWTLLAIVINAQLGASIFLLPSKLAAYGPHAILGWMVGGIGAIFIAMIFAFLCLETTKTGASCLCADGFWRQDWIFCNVAILVWDMGL